MSSSGARALQPPPVATDTTSSARTNWMFFFIGIIVFTIAMMLVSFPVGFYTVFGTHLSDNYSASTPVYSVGYDFFFATVQVPLVGNFGSIFVVLSAIYLAFLVLAARQGTGLLKALRASVSDGYDALFKNPLTATLVILGAVSFVTVLVDSFQTSAGVSTGSLSGDPFLLLVNFFLAPLTEEATFRMIMIGLPVLVLSLIMFREFSPFKVAKALWRPSSAWDVDEDVETEAVTVRSFNETGPSLFPDGSSDSLKVRAIKPVVYVFLFLSSFIFGYAHYASGIGWGPGKVSEAALAGVALGYLYVKYGFQTNVLMHWSINYVGTIFAFFGQAAYGVPWTSNTGSFLDIIPTVDIVYLLGVPSTLIVGNEILKRAMRNRR
ncbi:MAG: CPBP family glutamic-type intramembrane protease [Thaumarchaeota archaeon]|nr:CPBP family glutamic-type intramembrane protease [Nitrososphaerota archaeon]